MLVLVLGVLAGVVWRRGMLAPLEVVPQQLHGTWHPVAPAQPGVFLRIEDATLEWSAGPDQVERRELLGARRIEAVDAEGYSLHYREEEQVLTMRFELAANGLAHVGGRKSFAWRREGEP